MLNHAIKPSFTLFSTKNPICKRKSLGIGRIHQLKVNVLKADRPVVIKDQHGNTFDCSGFSNIQRLQLSLHRAELINHPIVFSHQGLNDNKIPINPVFLRLVPSATQWKAQQLKSAFA